MTSEERKLILLLVTYPGSGREGSPEVVLRHFGTDDGSALGLRLLRDSLDRRDGIDVELALIVGATFGVTEDYVDLLVQLSAANWHQSHEDIVSALAKLRTPRGIEALYQATQWVPEYLDYDDSRALATKAIWGLAPLRDLGRGKH
ncbi:HEAT repeat domain-containing protein [Streptomyces sp. NPDC000878]